MKIVYINTSTCTVKPKKQTAKERFNEELMNTLDRAYTQDELKAKEKHRNYRAEEIAALELELEELTKME